jgi:large conductance mechanosensitive channel
MFENYDFMRILKEFREFALKGNVFELAIAVVIGTAFASITSSLVKDVIMPPLSLALSGVDFTDLNIVLKPADAIAKKPEVVIHIGNFLNAVIQFIIVAFSIFLVVKAINSFKNKHEDIPIPSAPEPTPTKEELLLAEIRDLLAKGR